jgi:hypothetical protein
MQYLRVCGIFEYEYEYEYEYENHFIENEYDKSQNSATSKLAPLAHGNENQLLSAVSTSASLGVSMTHDSIPSRSPEGMEEEPWRIAVRWQEYDGELRACLLRILAVVLMYGLYLVQSWSVAKTEAAGRFHQQVTMISIVWLFLSLGTLMMLRARFMPAWMKYLTTAIDLVLVTLLCLLGHGPSSPAVMIFFLVQALSTLRFRVGLVVLATVGSMLGYMVNVGAADDSWLDANHSTPLLQQAITLATLASVGLVLSQILHVAKRVTLSYQSRATSGRSTIDG